MIKTGDIVTLQYPRSSTLRQWTTLSDKLLSKRAVLDETRFPQSSLKKKMRELTW